MAHHAADLGHIGDTLGEYVAGELQIFVRGLYRFSAPDGVGEGLEALLLRDLGARAALRLVRLVDIFEGALLPARGDLFAKAVRKLALFVDGLQYGLFAGLQLGVVFKTVFDLADGDFVEVAVGLFAVAGDKRHGSALGEKFFDGRYLAGGRLRRDGDLLRSPPVHGGCPLRDGQRCRLLSRRKFHRSSRGAVSGAGIMI